MKHSRAIVFIILSLLSLSLISGCDGISHGQQRRKFEFLYKTNNFAAVFTEFTSDIVNFSDLQLYETRMNRLYNDVNKFETVKGWTKSDAIKEDFLNSIDKNLSAAKSMQMKQSLYREFIKEEHEVIVMRETAEDFLNNVENEITVVGKE